MVIAQIKASPFSIAICCFASKINLEKTELF
jgi:hypothetical protein